MQRRSHNVDICKVYDQSGLSSYESSCQFLKLPAVQEIERFSLTSKHNHSYAWNQKCSSGALSDAIKKSKGLYADVVNEFSLTDLYILQVTDCTMTIFKEL